MNSINSMIENQATLVHVLKQRAAHTPDKNAYIFLEDGEDKEVTITYQELDRRARQLAATLQQKNQQIHNSRVLLIYPQSIGFLVSFFGSLYAGATAVLVSPPTSKKTATRLNGIVEDCDIAFILSTSKHIERMISMEVVGNNASHNGKFSTLEWINTDQLTDGVEAHFIEQEVSADDIAFLQYTSGSTGTPKGVMVSHSNLMANQRTIKKLYNNDENSVFVSWLPLIHDMGLIGKALQPMYLGVPLIFMAPLHFVQKPVRWLKAISKYRGTISGGPNFAFDLCVNKISDEEMQELDLSCWKSAFNGSEPVRRETVERFTQKFSQCKLPADAYMAVYGLAEATLIVSGTQRDKPLLADAETNYMPSGIADSCDVVKVVDPESRLEVVDGAEGEIWVHGPSVAQGYWNRPEATAETFQATLIDDERHFLRTGDTGFARHGSLHITGRIKDVIIIQGKNFHAEDIEWSTNELAAIRPGCCVAFSITNDGQEKLIVVAGVLTSTEEELQQLAKQIRANVYADHQLHLDRVVLIKPKELPTTTSGKVQRRLSKQMYLAGEFTPLLEHQAATTQSDSYSAEASKDSFVPAITESERELAVMWGDILSMPAEKVGMNDNFFELGGSSLTMLELATRLNVTMELLFRYPTINGYLYRTSEYEFPDVASDIYLPPLALDNSLQGKTGISLITGGTGFFGLHFLQAMMQRSQDQFVLMVRGASQEAIEKKFDDAVAYFKMENSIDKQRVKLVQGDLSKKQLGIPAEQYQWVVANVDKIFHIGSHVNNWLPYEGIREINVDGTRSLLQLARTGRKKELHYTSTSTFSPDKDDQSIFLEQDNIKVGDINRYFGYDISKYASEEMCKLARADGIVCNIYRLVWVGGHIETGLTKVGDGFNIMLRILLTIGAYPQGNYLHDVVPVDLMADSMASLIGKAENTNYNVTSQSKESIDMKRIAVMLRNMGYKLDEVSRVEFVERLRNYPIERWDEQCKSYRQLVIRLFEDPTPKVESFYDSSNFIEHMDTQLRQKMEQKFIDSWFEKTINFLVQNNALPTTSGLSYAEEMAQIARWNNTATAYPDSQCLQQMFAYQAALTPDAVAVEFERQSISYAALNMWADKIASHLIAQGVARNQFVGLSVSRSIELIACVLGILKAGAAYVPLDPTYPKASLDFMLEDSNAQWILVDQAAKEKLQAHSNKWLDVNAITEMADVSARQLAAIDAACQSHDLAYMVYTSGTTGTPKGVMVEHQSVLNHSLSLQSSFAISRNDKLLQFSTVNFDSFVEEVFPTLLGGATLVMVRQEHLPDIEKMQQIMRQHSVTVLKFSTAYWHNISDINVEKLGVRLVAIGGEEADLHQYTQWRQYNPTIPLINTYGPTETTVTASLSTLTGPVKKITIGKPIANTQMHILDAQLKPVPIGFVGDLYIAGAGVTRGYLNRPQDTAAAFIDNPFIDNPLSANGKMYKSGDLARWNRDGDIEFLGRSDNQVKVRGYRIELGAIESVIGCHPQIDNVAVVLKEHNRKKKIVAYFSSGVTLSAAEVRNYLEQALPSYMIPNLLLQLPAVPLNPNGKVDRKLLVDMAISASGNADLSMPQRPEDVKMAAIWESLLHVNNIGLHDDFMELGGHSLLVMSLLSEVQKQFGVQLPIHAIFDNPTIAKLTHFIEAQNDAVTTSNLVRFPDLNRGKGDNVRQSQPLFMVHGLGGHLASFYPLIRNLQKNLRDQYNLDITAYGLEANGFKDGEACFATLEEMVAEYVRLIQQTQPEGPYLIGGWSYGVSVAFHIAQELIQRGEKVSAFISIDAEAPHVPEDFDHFIQNNSILNLDDLYEPGTLQTLLDKFGRRFGFVTQADECAKQQFYRFLGYSKQDSEAQIERYSKIAIANIFNARGFNPSRINPMNTLLVRASKSSFNNYINDWHDLLESKMLSALTLNGDHWSIMQDPELAEHLARHVMQAVEQPQATTA
ncbi:amino acid adenylation domain-containing protein [Rheinheimera baltica]|uniref:Amino acid adenylation domain-containing protein n=1 Tax=Rheinheimera baltica TaxID=67576 RepID=A0ABT9HVG6_9GAMM|nr:amino acid adenylation domain-containing protein [Rheinheimera baltica]MDP5135116.1 amino acid adenylation domain-containing protein [Rheinheimera baltica]